MTRSHRTLLALFATLPLTLAGCDGSLAGDYEAFEDAETGRWVVEHPSTGAVWLRCPVGETYDPDMERCEGAAGVFTYEQALDACPEGFEWPDNAAFAAVLCEHVDISSCAGEQYGACLDCPECRSMFGQDTGRYVSASSSVSGDGGVISVFDFATGCATADDPLEDPVLNVRCRKP